MLEKLLHWSNERYRNAMLMFYTLVFGYLAIQSMLAVYAGAGTITMVIVAFFAIFTFVYWQPTLGLMAALVEFRVQSDDPKQKSTWRLYLMIVLASIMIGQLAIILHMGGVGHQFWPWTIALLVLVVTGLLRPGAELDKWLKLMAAIVITVTLCGTYFSYQSSARGIDGRKAHEISKTLTQIEQTQRAAGLDYIERIITCKSTDEDKLKAEWSEKQYSAYDGLCGRAIAGISRDELGKYWPNAALALKAYDAKKSSASASEASIENGGIAKYLTWSYWAQLAEKWGWPLLIAIVLGHLLLLIWGGKKIFGKSDGSTGGVATKKATSSDCTICWVLFFAAVIGGGLYYFWDEPSVVKFTGRGADAIHTDEPLQVGMSIAEVPKWGISSRSVNLHHDNLLPENAKQGKTLVILPGSYILEKVKLTVLDPTNPSIHVSFDGGCVPGNRDVPKICEGYWHGGDGKQGAYRMEWDNRAGRMFLIKMYFTRALEGHHIQELRGYLKDETLEKIGLSGS